MARWVSPQSAGANLLKGGGWLPEKDELVISKSPKRKNKLPRPGGATVREKGHMSGRSRGKAQGYGKEKEENYKLLYQVPGPTSRFSFLARLLKKKGGQDEGEGRGNKTPTEPLACFQCCKASSETSSREAQGGSPGREKEKTWWVSKEHFLLIMH